MHAVIWLAKAFRKGERRIVVWSAVEFEIHFSGLNSNFSECVRVEYFWISLNYNRYNVSDPDSVTGDLAVSLLKAKNIF